MAILEVNKLHKTYGKLEALKGLDFSIPAGKITGLVGPNGSGKTTLIKCINGFHKYEGRIKFMGEEIKDVNKTFIGYLGEGKNYYPQFTGEEYLNYFAELYDIDDAAEVIHDKLKAVGLYERRDDLIKTYSNGMKQRLGIARTLLQDPKLLIYDEPLAGLDPIIKYKINLIIREVSERQINILISSHQLKDIEDICDWVVLIKGGKIIDYGDPQDILERTHPIKDIVLTIDKGSISKAEKIMEEFDQVVDIITDGSTLIIKVEDKRGIESEIFRWFISNDIEFSLKRGTLDSMYRSVFK